MFVRMPITSSFLIRCVGSFGFAIPMARIDEILDVGLNLPGRESLKLIGRLEKGLARANGRVDRGLEELHLPVEAGCAAARPGGAHFDPEEIVVASRQWSVQGEARVDACADEIAILVGREHWTDEDIQAAIGVVVRTPDHLVHDPVKRKVAVMLSPASRCSRDWREARPWYRIAGRRICSCRTRPRVCRRPAADRRRSPFPTRPRHTHIATPRSPKSRCRSGSSRHWGYSSPCWANLVGSGSR